MKLSQIINSPLGLLGLKLVRLSKLKQLQETPLINMADIEADQRFIKLYEKIKEFTMVGVERCYALYKAVDYIIANKIQGDFVECGVWKGGSCMLIALMLKDAGIDDRKIWLYDTFSGMAEPGKNDGKSEVDEWAKNKISDNENRWCLAEIAEVEKNMQTTLYPSDKVKLIKGKVEDTIPLNSPNKVALLRLDTDWYESTKHELVYLYPLVEKNGVLIIDDYGTWEGAKKAVEEYFDAQQEPVYLNRIDFAGRLIIK